MKLIVGLGNPGADYKRSRHNVGFGVVDALARRWSMALTRRQHQARCGGGLRGGQPVVLMQPQTYMNHSGESVAAAVGFYRTELCDLLVIVDDMALPLGRLRLRGSGSAGGHNGLADIVARLGSDGFARLRVGIGAARPGAAVGHVLGSFTAAEQLAMDAATTRAADAAACWLEEGLDTAMNRFNVSPKDEEIG
jgi:PTH1 family peptidyl-tRNA hydrolase